EKLLHAIGFVRRRRLVHPTEDLSEGRDVHIDGRLIKQNVHRPRLVSPGTVHTNHHFHSLAKSISLLMSSVRCTGGSGYLRPVAQLNSTARSRRPMRPSLRLCL